MVGGERPQGSGDWGGLGAPTTCSGLPGVEKIGRRGGGRPTSGRDTL